MRIQPEMMPCLSLPIKESRTIEMSGGNVILSIEGGSSEIIVEGPAVNVYAIQKSIAESLSFNQKNSLLSKDSVIKETMVIDPAMMCYVTGYKMSKVKEVEKKHKVKICVGGFEERSGITVKGPVVNVYAAQQEIAEGFPYETDFFIEKDYIDLILKAKREIGMEYNDVTKQNVTNVTITINGDGKVVLSGKIRRCEAVKEAIESQIDAKKRAEATKKDILKKAKPYNLDFEIKERFAAKIRGPRGTTIQRLNDEFGVKISVEKGNVHISGIKSRVEAAKDAVKSLISDKRKMPDAEATGTSDGKRKKFDSSSMKRKVNDGDPSPCSGNKRKKTV